MYFTKKSCNSIKFTLKIKLQQENIMINSSETIAIWKNVSPFPSIFFVWISFSNPLNYEVPYPVWVWFKSLLTHSTFIEDSDNRTCRQLWPDCNRTATLLDEALSLRRRAPLAVTWSRCPYLPCTTPERHPWGARRPCTPATSIFRPVPTQDPQEAGSSGSRRDMSSATSHRSAPVVSMLGFDGRLTHRRFGLGL